MKLNNPYKIIQSLNDFIFFKSFKLFYKLLRFNSSKKHQKIYYILYESAARDFLPRLIIGLRLAQKNNSVIFISIREFLRISKVLPAGIVLTKGISSNISEESKDLFKNKFLQCVLDEEQFAIRTKNNLGGEIRVDKKTINLFERFYCWGNTQKEYIIKKYPNIKSKLLITGSPKFDLTTSKKFLFLYENELKEINKKYNDYIIFPSNFGIATLSLSKAKKLINKMIKDFKVKNKKEFKKKNIDFYKYKKKSLFKFIELIYKINKKYPNLNLILRPHPVDNHSFWKKVLITNERIHLDYKYSIHPWILGSKLLIHNHCTTSIEAHCFGKSSVCYSPLNTKNVIQTLYFKTSQTSQDEKNIFKYIDKALKNKLKLVKKDKNFKSSLSNKPNIFSSELIANDMNKININKYNPQNYLLSIKISNILSFSLIGFLRLFTRTYKTKRLKTKVDFDHKMKFDLIQKILKIPYNMKISSISEDFYYINKI